MREASTLTKLSEPEGWRRGSRHSVRSGLTNVPYRLSEVVHRLGQGLRTSSPATAGEQLRRRSSLCYLESGRRTNLTLLSQLTSLIRLFDGDRTQSYSHAYSDAGSSCLALYDLQPVTDHAKNQPHETKQPS